MAKEYGSFRAEGSTSSLKISKDVGENKLCLSISTHSMKLKFSAEQVAQLKACLTRFELDTQEVTEGAQPASTL